MTIQAVRRTYYEIYKFDLNTGKTETLREVKYIDEANKIRDQIAKRLEKMENIRVYFREVPL